MLEYSLGDEASYRGVSPKRPFDPAGHAWGAVELAARYSELESDDKAFPVFANPASAMRREKAWALGLNWYLNRNVRVLLDYEKTRFQGGVASGDREDENLVFGRFQIAF